VKKAEYKARKSAVKEPDQAPGALHRRKNKIFVANSENLHQTKMHTSQCTDLQRRKPETEDGCLICAGDKNTKLKLDRPRGLSGRWKPNHTDSCARRTPEWWAALAETNTGRRNPADVKEKKLDRSGRRQICRAGEKPKSAHRVTVTPRVSNPHDYINHIFKRP
jgi:hypothetical protein